MKQRVICAASIALFASLAFLSGCSGDGGNAVATDADAATDPAAAQGTGTDNGSTADPSGSSLGNSGSTDPTGSQGAGTESDAGAGAGDALDGSVAHDAAPGPKGDAGQGQAPRNFGEPCNRDTQCVSGACTRNGGGGGGGAGYCSIQCTVANQATLCTKPPTTGQCVRGFCGKP